MPNRTRIWQRGILLLPVVCVVIVPAILLRQLFAEVSRWDAGVFALVGYVGGYSSAILVRFLLGVGAGLLLAFNMHRIVLGRDRLAEDIVARRLLACSKTVCFLALCLTLLWALLGRVMIWQRCREAGLTCPKAASVKLLWEYPHFVGREKVWCMKIEMPHDSLPEFLSSCVGAHLEGARHPVQMAVPLASLVGWRPGLGQSIQFAENHYARMQIDAHDSQKVAVYISACYF